MINEILVEDGKALLKANATHQEYAAKAVIVTTGTASGEKLLLVISYSSGPNYS